MNVKSVLWTAFLIRVLSQLHWEWAWTTNLDMDEFVFGLVLVPGIWFVFELAKVISCVFAAFLALAIYRLVKRRLNLIIPMSVLVYFLITTAIAYPHAVTWAIADCGKPQNREEAHANCIKRMIAPWTRAGLWRGNPL